MRFSDTFLRQLRDRASIADYAGRKLAWDKRKSRPAAGDYWACCPFHTEKSASFHVLDTKGIYNCFGCGEKGDIFTLTMKLEGVSFPEAVAQTAERAGMAVPADETEDRAGADRRRRLYDVTAKAAALFAEALASRPAAPARAYLEKRGFTPEICARFGIGFAPDSWTWAIERLREAGFTIGEIIAAGLAREAEGKRPIDTFRGRITFEIADPGGKIVAFGARALDPAAKAKYINSPETPLFHKGATLYRLKQARELLAKTKAAGLVVAEGYFDVIAFERAGIGAVAPLGTALSEDQLALIWRAGPEPTLCFDGDDAGQRAAARALDLALPHLGPEKTLRIALIANGADPDDIYRNAGAEGLAQTIAAASPANEALFEGARRLARLGTPEGGAAFKDRLRKAASRIADAETRKLYLSELLSRADALLRSARPSKGPRGFRAEPPAVASAELRAAAARPPSASAEQFLRLAIDHPSVLARYGEWICRLSCPPGEVSAIGEAIETLLAQEDDPSTIDRAALARHLQRSGEAVAAARVLSWPKTRPARAGEARPGQAAGGDIEAEWIALVTREAVLPAIKEELSELRVRADAGDDAAFARFQALGREARAIEARAREAKLEEAQGETAAAEEGRDL